MINVWTVGVTVDNWGNAVITGAGDDPRQEETGVARVSAPGGRADPFRLTSRMSKHTPRPHRVVQ